LAGVLDNHDLAIKFARQGILSNASDFTLYNNLAFSLLNAGKLDAARSIIKHLHTLNKSTVDSIVLVATTGLLYFRLGEKELGRQYYRRAITLARQAKMEKLVILASIYLALEESRINADSAEGFRKEAIKIAARHTDSWVSVLVDRLRAFHPS
jgi:tetratricopeptide (TPR) repeat protein